MRNLLWSLSLVGVVGCATMPSPSKGVDTSESRAVAAKPAPTPANAEYAVRWNVAAGGPTTAEKVLSALHLEPKKDKDSGKTKQKNLTVEYFDVGKRSDGFKTILRLRTDEKKGESELTFKLRGDRAIVPPPCPLGGGVNKEPEVDVTFLDPQRPAPPQFSYSCDKKTKEAPKALPLRVGCTASMRRLEADFASDELKVEEWKIKGARYIEVSFSGKNDPADEKMFGAKVVAALVAKGIHPLEEGMTTITTSCTEAKK